MNQPNNSQYRKPMAGQQHTDSTGKLPPHDIELEEAVLGGLMIEKDAYMQVSDLLIPESFYDPRHQMIYAAIQNLGFNQRPIDMISVTEQLRADKNLDKVGGAVYITDLTARVYSAAHVEYHARIVAQKYLARRLINFSSSIESQAFDEANDVYDLLQQAEGKLFEISQMQLKREVEQIDPVINLALEQIQIAANTETGLSGLQTGFNDLDKLTGGWQSSDLIIIAARPAMGKTAFVLSMAKNMAIDYSIPTAIFTLEMAKVQLVKRLLSNIGSLTGDQIKSGSLSPSEWDYLNSQLGGVYGAPLYLDETPGLSITELRTKARRLVREHGVKIIMIDYLQLMTASGMKLGSREQEVSTISRSLKALAKELNIPIIALSQLNRSTETRDDKRPVLSDLRESGAIEQDADIVCFIHRPEYYTRSGEDSSGKDIRGLAELIIAKHRSGAVDTIDLRFISKFAKFENFSESFSDIKNSLNIATRMESMASKINTGGPDSSDDLPPLNLSDSFARSSAATGLGGVDLSPDSPDDIVPF